MVRDHRDELGIGRLAFDVRHRVTEELLQHLDVAAVPGDLDRVADFRDFRPERGDALSAFLVQGSAFGNPCACQDGLSSSVRRCSRKCISLSLGDR